MKTDTEQVLEQILLPLNSQWEITSAETDEREEEIYVKLRYKYDFVEDKGISYPIYDHRKERRWRHLDLWQYKTYIVAQLPRYIDSQGFFRTVSVPWADEYERLTNLLKKKR
ncbi:MAG: transposase family protein [Prevotellaceae bacterium]|jgi:hypothetical protein|nr:transposase family protein [Prevotellaceae bacterium]